MAARVFKVDELATRIATHLFAINPKSTVALALTCKALEVPALRTLWGGRFWSFDQLIMRVLPTQTWCFVFPSRDSDSESDFHLLALRRPLTARELDRLKRYASWIRHLDMREWGLSKELTQLVVPASARTAPALRLHLQDLQWWLNETNLSFFPKFLSPHLTRIFVTTDTLAGPGESIEPWHELPDEVVPKMCSAIKMFPSSLQCLRIRLGVRPETRLTGEISAFILGCGESFREFSTNLVLSTQAIVHLMRLPNLCEWVTEQGPPRVADLIDNGVPDGVTSLFPSLKALDLRSEVALEWLSLFETKKTNTPPWIMARGSLPTLKYYHPTLPIDSSLVSRLLLFVDLVEVSLGMGCFMRPCVSKFTDQDVERLASALPKLEALTLGRGPCHEDTCPTTVRSLLFLSVHCTKLEHLNIHFRTGNLRGDMVDLLGYAYSQNLHSRPKCALEALVTGQMFLQLDDHDYVLISLGMLMIFPSLVRFTTMCHMWGKMGVVVKTFRQVGRPLEVITDKLMKILNEIREKLENGVPVDSIDEMARVISESLRPEE